jgi:molybdenum cofactor biosynthesis enzyme MoaA
MNNHVATSVEVDQVGMTLVTFKAYLDTLAAIERRKPEEQRKTIPTLEEIAAAAGIHPVTLSNTVNNKVKLLNLASVTQIIAFMRARGFPMEVSDFLEYRDV